MENSNQRDPLRSFRFSHEVDRYIRRPGMHRGDVKRRIVKPLIEMDEDGSITQNNLVRVTRKKGPSKAAGTYYITTATIPAELYERLRVAASQKRMSIALFVDRLLLAYYKERKQEGSESERERLLAESQRLLSQLVSFQMAEAGSNEAPPLESKHGLPGDVTSKGAAG